MIQASALGKVFVVADKAAGVRESIRHLLRRRQRRIEAVADVHFEIGQGEIVGLLGPNGAGKTTALKMLSGLIQPTHGRAMVAGHVPFRREREFLRRITFVMGNKQQLIWELPAIESLRVHAAVYEIPDREAARRMQQLAEMLEVTDQLTQPVRKLSLGERMKMELLASLLHQPDVLFLDEPTLGLDVNAQATIRAFLRRYNEERKATVLLTSHYMADITALCRRILVIDSGCLIYDGDLESLLEQYTLLREVTLEVAGPVAAAFLPEVGQGLQIEGRRIRLKVERDRLPAALASLMAVLEVVDLAVSDPPVEQIIGSLFKGGACQEPMA